MTGYLFIALSVILLLALISFVPEDSRLFVSQVESPVGNIVGKFGADLASWIVLIYGKYAAYMLSFAVFIVGVNLLVQSKLGKILLKMSLFIMTVISISVLVSVIITDATYMEGGLIGTLVAGSLLEIFPNFVLIPIFGLIILLSLSASMKLFRNLTVLLAKGVGIVVFWPILLFKKARAQTEPPTDLELEREFNGTQANPVRIEDSIMTRNVTHLTQNQEKNVEVTRLSEPEKEPEFLNPGGDSSEQDEHSVTFHPTENAPEWLSGDGIQRVLDTVQNFYDRMIYQSSIEIETAEQEEERFRFEQKPQAEEKESLPQDPSVREEESVQPEISHDEYRDEEDGMGVDIETIQHELEKSPQPDPDEELSEPVELDNEAEDILDNIDEEADTQPETVTPEPEIVARNHYRFPTTDSLDRSLDRFTQQEEQSEINRKTDIIETTFESFKIEIKVNGFSRGPAITRYELIPPEGLKLKSIVNLTDDLALKLGTKNIRIVAPIGSKSMIGVEVPNRYRKTIVLRDIIESEDFRNCDDILPLIMGMDLTGNIIIKDLAAMPHLLIAGTTGSGKSVYVNSLIAGLVFKLSQDELKFIMIDPKMVELELYNGIPHLLCPIITQPEEALAALEWAVREMDRRYKMLSEFSVRNITDYNDQVKKINQTRMKNDEVTLEELPFIVIVIDEFANLMLRSPKETEKVISRIAAMARAVGIHLVIATQRPSVDVVTGIIKANFPSRIAFRVISKTDSRTILDENGAESLLDKGDMLFRIPSQRDMMRIQSPFVSNRDVESIVAELKQNGAPEYVIDLDELMDNTVSEADPDKLTDYTSDELYPDVLKEAVSNGEISASFIQRKFRVGFNRASRLMESLDQLGILAASEGSSKPRKVLISQEDLVNYL